MAKARPVRRAPERPAPADPVPYTEVATLTYGAMTRSLWAYLADLKAGRRTLAEFGDGPIIAPWPLPYRIRERP